MNKRRRSMKIRPGVVTYKGPEAEHKERLKKKLADARFIVKYLTSGIDYSEFQIFTMVVDQASGEKHIFYRKKEAV